jgi:hypothetical protein
VTPGERPALDQRTYEAVRDELLARIPVHAPEWTDFDDADPGVTMLELLAFLAEGILGFEGDHGLTRPDGTSETLAEVGRRLKGRLEHLDSERERVCRAIERIDAIQPRR